MSYRPVHIVLDSLSEALPAITDMDRLQMLVTHPAVRIVSDEPWSWRAHAATRDIVGRPDAASAVGAAISDRVWVLTRQPGLYAGIGDGDLVVPIPD